jgi:hypothetical protein
VLQILTDSKYKDGRTTTEEEVVGADHLHGLDWTTLQQYY